MRVTTTKILGCLGLFLCIVLSVNGATIFFNPVTYSVTEGDLDGSTSIDVNVCQAPVNTDSHTAAYISTNDSSAVSGSDFAPISSNTIVTIPAGVSCTPHTINIRSDSIPEESEQFFVELLPVESFDQVLQGLQTATVTIDDDDNPAGVTISLTPVQYTVTEGDVPGQTSVTVNICHNPSNIPTTAYVSTFSGTADTGLDFESLSNRAVTLPANEGCTVHPISIVSDVTPEETEQFTVQLSSFGSLVQVPRGSQTATVTITDDDVTVSFNPVMYAVTEGNVNGGTSVDVIICHNPISSSTSGLITTVPDTAQSGFDFLPITSSNGAFTIPSGQPCTSYSIIIVSDSLPEEAEQFTVQLFALSSSVTVSAESGTATVTINDDDSQEGTTSMPPSSTTTPAPELGTTPSMTTSTTPDLDECNSSPCRNGGQCVNLLNRYQCICTAGYTGTDCVTDLDECNSSPCRNGGQCVNLLNRYQCICTAGYTGTDCVTDINECNSSPCQNGGQCVDQVNGYGCTCQAGFIGTNCATELPVLNSAPIHEDISNHSITIIWRAWDTTIDDGDPPIVAYIPYYRMDASDVWISGPRILSNKTLQFKADNLQVDTLYEFSVAVVREGKNGEGPRGQVVLLKTYCNVPDVPVSINVQLTSTNKVSVSWQLPPGEVMCSTGVTSYKVYYRIEGSIDDTPQLAGTVEDADTTSLIVDDGLLEPGTSYIFFVTVITDQESGFRESEAIQAPADMGDISSETSAPVYLISLIIIPVLLMAVIVLFILKRRKNISKDKKATKADDGDGTDYVNTAIADDPEDNISLEEQSRTVSSSKYEDLNLKPQGGASIPTQYEVTIVPQPQKPVATPIYQTRNVKGVNSGAYEDISLSSENRQLPDVPQSHPSAGDEDEDNSYEVPDKLEEYAGVYINIKAKPVQPGPIKVQEFQNFMSRNKEDVVNDIVQQFMALPSGRQYPWSVALKFQNKPRNFFKTILAYDHSRVKLDTNGSDARSDYINASYIKNQQEKTSFIAAQGPQEGTVDDFWKMVWQENVEIIVMVTDNIEKSKLLCYTYWPEKVRTSEVFGDISVLLMESTSYTTHTIRKLNLFKGNHKTVHTVTQVHVHSWPYGGVPKEPAPLISITKKVKSLQKDGSSSPLLVHCSNGVGATGTFIAVYVLMDTIKKNKDVNIFDFVKKMREDRVDMVQTRTQYLFIFECMLAVLQSTDSQISCDQLKKLDDAAIKLKSEKEYKVLQESVKAEQPFENYDGNSPENQHKNRFKDIIPVDKFRPVLKSGGSTFGSNSYINAIHLTDFGGREFIMTQAPLSSTVEDFWRLVYDYECTTIVMLNTVGGSDETIVQYWPGGAHGSAQYGLMTVECTSTTKRDSCILSQFQVAHKKVGEKSLSVDHFAFSGWSTNQPNVSKLQQLIRCTGNKNNGPVLVHCINGVGLSAVYVSVKTESERLEQEGSVDVFDCLTKLRKICPHAIQTQEEYTLCYQLLKDHLDNPEEYAVVY